jgi:hypothetical protein
MVGSSDRRAAGAAHTAIRKSSDGSVILYSSIAFLMAVSASVSLDNADQDGRSSFEAIDGPGVELVRHAYTLGASSIGPHRSSSSFL